MDRCGCNPIRCDLDTSHYDKLVVKVVLKTDGPEVTVDASRIEN